MLRRALGVAMVFLLMASAIPASAMERRPESLLQSLEMSNSDVRAYLSNRGTQQTIDIPVEVLDVTPTQDGFATTYRVRISDSVFDNSVDNTVVAPLASGSPSDSRTDDSLSWEMTITQYWTDFHDGGRRYVKVSKYTGVWRQLDRQVGAKDAILRAGCNGPFWDGGWCYDVDELVVGRPTSGQVYTLVPNWSTRYVGVASQLFYQCGVIEATLVRFGQTWDFWFSLCQGSPEFSW